MPSSTSFLDSGNTTDSPGQRLALWIGLLAGPLVWLGVLEANYVLSYVSCEMQHSWFMHAVTAAAVVIVVAAGLAAWRLERRTFARARWMARGGALMCTWFTIVILATDLPVLVLPPCR